MPRASYHTGQVRPESCVHRMNWGVIGGRYATCADREAGARTAHTGTHDTHGGDVTISRWARDCSIPLLRRADQHEAQLHDAKSASRERSAIGTRRRSDDPARAHLGRRMGMTRRSSSCLPQAPGGVRFAGGGLPKPPCCVTICMAQPKSGNEPNSDTGPIP
ncbi:hypothetical protein BC834DRAFT_147188 [Gloeopeniophorella convolvens]|nr:hypothetical protein BC834DRAFT_147188 [Gloeopeniophorella convolvens]